MFTRGLVLQPETYLRILQKASGLPRNFKGAAVVSVVENSPADKAGVRGQVSEEILVVMNQVRSGDIVTKIDSQPVKSMDDVISYLDESKKVGDKVTLTVNREGQNVECTYHS